MTTFKVMRASSGELIPVPAKSPIDAMMVLSTQDNGWKYTRELPLVEGRLTLALGDEYIVQKVGK